MNSDPVSLSNLLFGDSFESSHVRTYDEIIKQVPDLMNYFDMDMFIPSHNVTTIQNGGSAQVKQNWYSNQCLWISLINYLNLFGASLDIEQVRDLLKKSNQPMNREHEQFKEFYVGALEFFANAFGIRIVIFKEMSGIISIENSNCCMIFGKQINNDFTVFILNTPGHFELITHINGTNPYDDHRHNPQRLRKIVSDISQPVEVEIDSIDHDEQMRILEEIQRTRQSPLVRTVPSSSSIRTVPLSRNTSYSQSKSIQRSSSSLSSSSSLTSSSLPKTKSVYQSFAPGEMALVLSIRDTI